MPESHGFLTNLALVLCVAALTSLVFQLLRQPVVFGYLIAGMIVGPYVPVPLAADPGMVRTLAELGVIMLMFSIGLEFSMRRLLSVGGPAGIAAIIQPGGSVKDNDVIAACNEHKIGMIFTGRRHFKH